MRIVRLVKAFLQIKDKKMRKNSENTVCLIFIKQKQLKINLKKKVM